MVLNEMHGGYPGDPDDDHFVLTLVAVILIVTLGLAAFVLLHSWLT